MNESMQIRQDYLYDNAQGYQDNANMDYEMQTKEDMEDNLEISDGQLKLFIGGLNYLSLKSDIKSYFETFGRVSGCTLLVDKSSGKSRGFAFVTIEDPDGEIRIKILNRKHEINGKIVDVKPAVEGKQREEMLDASRKIFVGGLDPSVKNEDLANFFNRYGDVREAVVLYDNNRGASRCFGFVTFDQKETVDLLVRENNYVLKGKQIDVKQAMPKSQQKMPNIISQSGIDILLNTKPKNIMRENANTYSKPYGGMGYGDEHEFGGYGMMPIQDPYNREMIGRDPHFMEEPHYKGRGEESFDRYHYNNFYNNDKYRKKPY